MEKFQQNMTQSKEFKVCFEFWKEKDYNGSVTLAILLSKIKLFYYHNGNEDMVKILKI